MKLLTTGIIILLPFASSYTHKKQPTKTTISSISGDCVQYSTRSDSSLIEVVSSSILNDNPEPRFIYFRGGGEDSTMRTDTPNIGSVHVYESLFTEEYFPLMFSHVEVKFGATSSKLRKIQLLVKEEKKAFTVGNTGVAYFWGPDKLPSILEECFNYQSTNDNLRLSYCNTTQMDRCAANISDFPHLTPFTFSSKGKELTQFAWLCPAGTVCCAWECCEESESQPHLSVFILVFIFAMLVVLIVAVVVILCILYPCCTISCCKKRKEGYVAYRPGKAQNVEEDFTEKLATTDDALH